jgi:hypothetical protein
MTTYAIDTIENKKELSPITEEMMIKDKLLSPVKEEIMIENKEYQKSIIDNFEKCFPERFKK